MNLFIDGLAAMRPTGLILAVAILDLTAIGRALLRGHGVTSTLAWILAVLAFPGLGAIAYLLLANPSVRRTVRRKAASVSGVAGTGMLDASLSDEERRVTRLARELTGLPGSAGNAIELLIENEKAFERIEQALMGARRAIWAEYYIVRNDETGHRFLETLLARAQAGVGVRLLYDAVGSLGLDADCLRAIRAAGGKVEPFLPVNPLRRRWAVHLRNHRKLIVVDGCVAFTGGMNVGDEYSGRSRLKGGQYFRDVHLRIAGSAVRDFASVFADDWKFATDESLQVAGECVAARGDTTVLPLPSGPDQPLNASAHLFFAGIMSARRQCFVTTPYFVPDEPSLRALITAAKSGVDVRIMVPARTDVRLVGWAARSFYRELVDAGVRLFEYQTSMLHAKSIVVDETWGIVGSANVDMRSFRLNFEMGAVLFDREIAGRLVSRFLADCQSSVEITRSALRRTSLARRLAQGVARLLSPVL